MQNAWASCLVLVSSCFAFVDLIFWRVRSYSCGDLSHCRCCCCSRYGDMSVCYVIQTGESSSGTCCIHWDVKVRETWSWHYRQLGQKAARSRSRNVISDWDRESLESGTVVWFWFPRFLCKSLLQHFLRTLHSSKSFRKMSSLLRCESNAFPNVWSMRKIVINVSSVRSMFIK